MVGKHKWAGMQHCPGDGGQPSLVSTPATSAMHSTSDMPSAMSPFARFTSGVDPKADVVGRLCRRMKMILSRHLRPPRKLLLQALTDMDRFRSNSEVQPNTNFFGRSATRTITRFCPSWVLLPSFDHLIGTQQNRRWKRNPERLRDLEVQNEQDARRYIHRHIGRFCTL